jgi:putative (di)nucleoside polyphosphate hydrolase
MKKAISAGVIITDGENFLICHPTYGEWWDIPKGKQDPGEEPIETAVRELKEETGLKVSMSSLKFLGKFKYRVDKDLVLYMLEVDMMPDVSKLYCESKFKHGKGYLPEMDKFAIVDRTTCLSKVNPSLNALLSKLI